MYRSNKHSMSSSLPGASTNILEEKLIRRRHLELLSQPQSQSQAGSRRQHQQKVRRAAEKYIFELLMNPKSVFYTSALKYFKQ